MVAEALPRWRRRRREGHECGTGEGRGGREGDSGSSWASKNKASSSSGKGGRLYTPRPRLRAYCNGEGRGG